MNPNLPSPENSSFIDPSSLAAAAGLLLLLVLLALLHWGGGLGEGGARDHEALAGLVRHRMGFLGCRVALRVGGDHEARGQGLTWCEPLSLGVVQAAHSRHVRCRHAWIRVASRVGRRCVGHRHAGVLLQAFLAVSTLHTQNPGLQHFGAPARDILESTRKPRPA